MPGPPTAGSSALQAKPTYTVADYLSWDDGQRWELIAGEAFAMSPAPSRIHQKVVLNLGEKLTHFLKGKPCEPYIAPTDVFLPPLADAVDQTANTVVQPDVLVVCDPAKLIDAGIQGAPDFIIEVLSDSTALKDLTRKKALYEAHGVKEYWLVSQDDGTVLAYRLEGQRYQLVQEYRPEDPVPSQALLGFIWESRVGIFTKGK